MLFSLVIAECYFSMSFLSSNGLSWNLLIKQKLKISHTASLE